MGGPPSSVFGNPIPPGPPGWHPCPVEVPLWGVDPLRGPATSPAMWGIKKNIVNLKFISFPSSFKPKVGVNQKKSKSLKGFFVLFYVL